MWVVFGVWVFPGFVCSVVVWALWEVRIPVVVFVLRARIMRPLCCMVVVMVVGLVGSLVVVVGVVILRGVLLPASVLVVCMMMSRVLAAPGVLAACMPVVLVQDPGCAGLLLLVKCCPVKDKRAYCRTSCEELLHVRLCAVGRGQQRQTAQQQQRQENCRSHCCLLL
jgi:hypothetical protein